MWRAKETGRPLSWVENPLENSWLHGEHPANTLSRHHVGGAVLGPPSEIHRDAGLPLGLSGRLLLVSHCDLT